MKFSLYITSNKKAPTQAYQFAKETISQGKQINCIFLHDEGVLTSQCSALSKKWSQLATTNTFDIILCSQSAQQRDIAIEDLKPGFQIDSLMHLLEAEKNADRIIHFKS